MTEDEIKAKIAEHEAALAGLRAEQAKIAEHEAALAGLRAEQERLASAYPHTLRLACVTIAGDGLRVVRDEDGRKALLTASEIGESARVHLGPARARTLAAWLDAFASENGA